MIWTKTKGGKGVLKCFKLGLSNLTAGKVVSIARAASDSSVFLPAYRSRY